MKDTPFNAAALVSRMSDGLAVVSSPQLKESLEALGLNYTESADQIQLTTPLELLDAEKIQRGLSPKAIELVSKIETHWSIGSTNTYLMDRTQDTTFHGSVCLAEQQVSGRGRRGRRWVSPFGKNIYLSIGWYLPSTVGIAGLSLVMGMQVIKSLRAVGLADVGLKWPNDILLKGGKLCGILIEVAAPHGSKLAVVTGVGVNLQLGAADAKDIDQPWSAAADVTSVSRNNLGSRLISSLMTELEQFSMTGFAPYVRMWNAYNVYAGQPVSVLIGGNVVEGVDQGVDEQGNLRLKTSAGVKTFNAGEVSLRGRL